MTRLLLLLFTLNTLLFPIGAAAMMPFGADTIMHLESVSSNVIMKATTNEDGKASHCSNSSSRHLCDMDDMSSELCKAKCATSCSTSPLYIADFAFYFPLNMGRCNPKIDVTPIYNSRSISPELQPPLV
jgi:hypothetical protein